MQNEILSNETATPQTNFGLYNIGSEMLWDRATAIWSINFLSETRCRIVVKRHFSPTSVFQKYLSSFFIFVVTFGFQTQDFDLKTNFRISKSWSTKKSIFDIQSDKLVFFYTLHKSQFLFQIFWHFCYKCQTNFN